MKRSAAWELAFHDFLMSRAATPYTPGKNDCALFAADGIHAMTGVDVAEAFRGYKTDAGALKAIRKVTGGAAVEDAAAWCAQQFDMPELQFPLMARRGDLCLIEDAGHLHLGLIHLNGRDVVAPGAEGLLRLPHTSIKRAWRVG